VLQCRGKRSRMQKCSMYTFPAPSLPPSPPSPPLPPLPSLPACSTPASPYPQSPHRRLSPIFYLQADNTCHHLPHSLLPPAPPPRRRYGYAVAAAAAAVLVSTTTPPPPPPPPPSLLLLLLLLSLARKLLKLMPPPPPPPLLPVLSLHCLVLHPLPPLTPKTPFRRPARTRRQTDPGASSGSWSSTQTYMNPGSQCTDLEQFLPSSHTAPPCAWGRRTCRHTRAAGTAPTPRPRKKKTQGFPRRSNL